ncbi:NAD(P)/FAD-dependent oxidoreductase [Methylobacterium sp. WSM2598]|uniref:NAD(P)/FAD-dependent oxidoreductase n=1 Tax=Methylobacterium sp. WSM2598 TaxID=398261 RepID=UPI000373D2D4|nr:FAD-binding oxidoreductase [Methylobacterium sp. WSM2598]
MALHVAVIGAGIVGAATALDLVRAGCRVTLIEPGEPGGAQAASYGNGAWISPGSIVPMALPGTWRRVPGYLLDPAGPLTIRWADLPRLAPWLARFLLAGRSVAAVERTARALAPLLADAPSRHAALAAGIGRPDLIRREGLLYAYPDRAAFAAEALAWRLRRDNGLSWVELGPEDLSRRVPCLSGRYGFGVLIEEGAHCVDPGGYVAALVAEAVARGAVLARIAARDFRVAAGRLRAVMTEAGEIPCDRAVIAAGIGAGRLARLAGDRVPLASERGYHVVVPAPRAAPRIPIMPSDGRMANTLTMQGLRLAGQVELARVEAAPDWRRAAILLRHANAAYPDLRATPEESARWMGHRPSTPDGLPVIGPASSTPDIVHAFGHGHVGLAAGPITGRAAGALARGAAPPLDIGPYAARRFRRWPGA